VHVGGDTAEVIDRLADLGSRLPWMALIVALATFVLSFSLSVQWWSRSRRSR